MSIIARACGIASRRVEARRIIEAVIAAIVDPRGNPAEPKSVETEIVRHVMRPSFSIFTRASLDIRNCRRISRGLANNTVREETMSRAMRTATKDSSACRMAPSQSIAHARLMGAISPEVRSTVRLSRTLPSQMLRRVFCCPTHGSFEHPGASRNGRPGSRGSRRTGACPTRGACRRERGDEPDTDGRANSEEFANAARRQAPR